MTVLFLNTQLRITKAAAKAADRELHRIDKGTTP
jgi:hypothetical protein